MRNIEWQAIASAFKTPALASGIDFLLSLTRLRKKWSKKQPEKVPLLEMLVQGCFQFLDRATAWIQL